MRLVVKTAMKMKTMPTFRGVAKAFDAPTLGTTKKTTTKTV
ncbi:hypothetical protein [Maritalea sp.]